EGAGIGGERRRVGPGEDRAGCRGIGDERAGLARLERRDLVERQRPGRGFGGDVERLAEYHALGAGGAGEGGDERDAPLGGTKGGIGEKLERERLKRVARKDGGGLVPFDV